MEGGLNLTRISCCHNREEGGSEIRKPKGSLILLRESISTNRADTLKELTFIAGGKGEEKRKPQRGGEDSLELGGADTITCARPDDETLSVRKETKGRAEVSRTRARGILACCPEPCHRASPWRRGRDWLGTCQTFCSRVCI